MKFSHNYCKMPDLSETTMLLQVFACDARDLSPEFKKYDTSYHTLAGISYYPIPEEGRVLVMLLLTGKHLWTTVRSWNTDKEAYYKEMQGGALPIEVE